MSSTKTKNHIYPAQKKTGESVAMAVSVCWFLPLALKKYQVWLQANGLKSAGYGNILENTLIDNNDKIREFVKEVKKENTPPKSRRYMDVVKDARKRG